MTALSLSSALLGGLLIGLAATLLLAMQGRVMGVSGIVSELLHAPRLAQGWRWTFLLGLLASGLVVRQINPDILPGSPRPLYLIALAGLLVGYGTRLGNGCTSGHGVCGISRFSQRSIVATLVFIMTGMLTVWLMGGK